MRAVLCLVVLLVCSTGIGQDKNTELIQGLVTEVIQGVAERSEIEDARQRTAALLAFAERMDRRYWVVTVHLEIEEVVRPNDGSSGFARVKPASELPDNLPENFAYTNQIRLQRFSKDVASRLAVGDVIEVTGPIAYQGKTLVDKSELVLFAIPASQEGQVIHHRVLVGAVDRKLTTSIGN